VIGAVRDIAGPHIALAALVGLLAGVLQQEEGGGAEQAGKCGASLLQLQPGNVWTAHGGRTIPKCVLHTHNTKIDVENAQEQPPWQGMASPLTRSLPLSHSLRSAVRVQCRGYQNPCSDSPYPRMCSSLSLLVEHQKPPLLQALNTAMVAMNGTRIEKPDGWVNGVNVAFNPIWDRGRDYSSVVLSVSWGYACPGVCIPPATWLTPRTGAHSCLGDGTEGVDVLVLDPAKAAPCSDLETSKELYATVTRP
jgi:hypothetical protein